MSGLKLNTLIKYVLNLKPLKVTISIQYQISQNQYFDNMSTCIIGRWENNLYANCKVFENLFTRSLLRVPICLQHDTACPRRMHSNLVGYTAQSASCIWRKVFFACGGITFTLRFCGLCFFACFVLFWLLFSLVFLSVCTIYFLIILLLLVL